MLNLKLNYYTHLILTSKYKLLINLFIMIIIYFVFYYDRIVFCMNENLNIIETPVVAEAKAPVRPSHQVLALRRNIQAYAGSIASQLESRDQIIEDSKNEISQLIQHVDQQRVEIQTLKTNIQSYANDLRAYNHEIATRECEIKNLTKSIEGYSPRSGVRFEGYKEQVSNLEKQVAELRNELHISETLLAEAKADKNKLFEIIERALEREK